MLCAPRLGSPLRLSHGLPIPGPLEKLPEILNRINPSVAKIPPPKAPLRAPKRPGSGTLRERNSHFRELRWSPPLVKHRIAVPMSRKPLDKASRPFSPGLRNATDGQMLSPFHEQQREIALPMRFYPRSWKLLVKIITRVSIIFLPEPRDASYTRSPRPLTRGLKTAP